MLVVAVIIAVIGLLAGQGEQTPVVAANVRDIQEQPAEYLGKRVVVSGRVNEVLTHSALTLGSDLAADPLLVLVEKSAMLNGYALDGYSLDGAMPMTRGPLYQKGDVVQFLGTLEGFDRASLAEQLDLVLNEELFGALEGEPVLLVERLDVTMFGGVFPSPVPIEDTSPAPSETPGD